jgi:hypothetical protein
MHVVRLVCDLRCPMSLNIQLNAFKRAFEGGVSLSLVGALHRVESALRQSDVLEQALMAHRQPTRIS